MRSIEILEKVKAIPGDEDELYRPTVLELDPDLDRNLEELMLTCWCEDPHDRPDFAVIRRVVRNLNK